MTDPDLRNKLLKVVSNYDDNRKALETLRLTQENLMLAIGLMAAECDLEIPDAIDVRTESLMEHFEKQLRKEDG